ncbi:hypothetical protein SAMN05443245_2212 [Paraburkholderia fungorum]|uniref:Uncharacterized protein n=1 Tax=Paraburkholderia fungorum TaxID=134537 RepID=A0A1H1CLT4_9BURK|nr:hypothetical protein SAMN05443245_2212 [Paraburkholderia fungorum]
MLTSALYTSRRNHRSARETEPFGLRFFCPRTVFDGAVDALCKPCNTHADDPANLADAPKSQCYTARTIHVAYPQQAWRRQTGSLE